jgi:hypothetical protein
MSKTGKGPIALTCHCNSWQNDAVSLEKELLATLWLYSCDFEVQ